MRVRLFKEVARYPNGYFIPAGSLDITAYDAVPLYSEDWTTLIGKVTDLRREEDVISGEISVDVDTEWFDFSLTVDKVVKDEEKHEIISGRVRGFALNPISYAVKS